ncbi:hypothetical protein MXB_4553 [Myxobolus squamalis]|nr:hypothetical protein MXB_4553 [Myxobolus squamalis]
MSRRSSRITELDKGKRKYEKSFDSSSDEEAEVKKRHQLAKNLRKNAETHLRSAKDKKKRMSFLLKTSKAFSEMMTETDEFPKIFDLAEFSESTGKKELDESDYLEDSTKSVFYFDDSPSFIKGGTMRDYQLRGLNWLISLYNNGINGILADEMGLGKTLQTISLLGYMKHYLNCLGPHVVIVPKSTIANWVNEFKRWCPTIKVVYFNGTREERHQWFTDVVFKGEWEVIIVTYEICIKDKTYFNKIYFKYIVIDEAHRIKNEKSKLSEIVRGFKSSNRLLLTGTPLQNNLHELWAFWYRQILLKDIGILNKTEKVQRSGLMNILMQLRKCCNHPYLFSNAEMNLSIEEYGRNIVENSGKMRVLDKLLPRLKSEGSRVLLFSQMTRLLDIIEDYLIFRKYGYCRLDGSTPHDIRTQNIAEFNSPDSTKFIFILSTRAGGLGINLATADIVIIYDTEIKLRLDNVVIQQGRLVDQNAKVSDNEIYNMIRHDAETIFASTDKNVTDEDVDAILAKSETKTAEQSRQLQQIGDDNLRNFSCDQPDFMYNFEGENYQNKKKLHTYQPIWIEPAKRERKANYGVDAYYKDVMNEKIVARNSTPKPLKQPVIYDFQFYPKKLWKLLEQENLAYQKSVGYRVEAFLKNLEKYGKDDITNVALDIETKSFEEVQVYCDIFWKRFKELNEYEKINLQLQKGEAKIQKIKEIKDILSKKLSRYDDPWYQLKIHYGTNKGKGYTEEEDRFIICMLHKIGLEKDDVYERLRLAFRVTPTFRMDWFIKSRSSSELARRCGTLILMIQKELEENTKLKKENEKIKTPVEKDLDNLSLKSRTRRSVIPP